MKTTINIDIECTPAEARSFLGLPDVDTHSGRCHGTAAGANAERNRQLLSKVAVTTNGCPPFPRMLSECRRCSRKCHDGIWTGQAVTPGRVRTASARLTRTTVRLCPCAGVTIEAQKNPPHAGRVARILATTLTRGTAWTQKRSAPRGALSCCHERVGRPGGRAGSGLLLKPFNRAVREHTDRSRACIRLRQPPVAVSRRYRAAAVRPAERPDRSTAGAPCGGRTAYPLLEGKRFGEQCRKTPAPSRVGQCHRPLVEPLPAATGR